MSLQKKLERERAAGIEHGTIASWELFTRALDETPGIGPKRTVAIMATATRLAQEKVKELGRN
ncbi:hypothetical protein EEL30_01040 (plasmid) [Brevibacillus laterosporus]|uniref:Uncharacterized protein n=1 Tax=Brevibacillus laterosporus TaxID=1465 RepID=A0A518V285_BRELA|nr:hypothetical protein EEL30_01040 [Brevibacillus laterosporus]